jgi:hypothetical protein
VIEGERQNVERLRDARGSTSTEERRTDSIFAGVGERGKERDKPGKKGRFSFCLWRLGQQRFAEKMYTHFYCIAYALLYF